MARADKLTIAAGTPGIDLMNAAGGAVADVAQTMLTTSDLPSVLILCGPGNNGGDGFVAARLLHERGLEVKTLLLKKPSSLKGDAALAYAAMSEAGVPQWLPLTPASLKKGLTEADLVIDALFGAGLDRPLEGGMVKLAGMVNAGGVPVLAVDLPSGVNGADGSAGGGAVRAERTVTFFRQKPGHLLFPGRGFCGVVDCVQIGIKASVLEEIEPDLTLNDERLWRQDWHSPAAGGHKYDRGHAVVFGGPVHATGAGRLAAGAALRAGAGLVTLACPPSALMVNACHLTAVMVRPLRRGEELSGDVEDEGSAGPIREMLEDKRLNAALIGPGFGVGPQTRECVMAVLGAVETAVLDADALTSYSSSPEALFFAIAGCRGPVVLTPHAGEFRRLFPDLFSLDKLSAARQAAQRSGAVVVLKGADTVIAAPDGRAAINGNAPAWLATAGSGDVLGGIILGLLAQGMPGFEAAAMGVWMHGEAGRQAGPGLTAEDLAPYLKPVIARLVEKPGQGAHEIR
ncbi:NAD(P)H-hydrate dehydratase [Roseibium litorale]|uniref:Bifunctional NAD(P)H-hydrate repair enzyme n=1 Tax=Roseibium litorale TaxID=2803841 RepID=A0ABR9CTK6_9HYPH|nr:NAD(P)H-hydrate dehydratase [Roseibium litorale]MBD8894212.1 NAD(P)H-hydrate dehydratase [Roseibium litorale]